MLDPKLPDALVRVREGETVVRLGVGKASGIEIQAQPVGFGPVNPILKMGRGDFIARDAPAARFRVNGVQRQAMAAGNE